MSTRPYIEFRDVSVRFADGSAALDRITLQIMPGEFTFLVGETGAGKSTLIRCLTREVRHTEGELRVDGEELNGFREHNVHRLRRKMGIVPQNYELLPNKRVFENVAYAMRAVGHSRQEVRRRVPEILQMVKIAHRADAYPDQLSGGEQQRVAIGRAIINRPPLIVADEPTGNLDPGHSGEIMEVLRELHDRGVTVLVASHDTSIIERFAKRVVTLSRGRVAEDRTTDAPEVAEEPA